ncbi:MAG: curli biogenesis system outer membrane secretion channel CsgG [Bacteroidia bacterium]|jgi:curli biogenesis system outer membrane secretion channel CsgG
MKRPTLLRSLALSLVMSPVIFLSGCATQPKPIETEKPNYSLEEQKAAQTATIQASQEATPALKRKIAIGRVTNETIHGRSLLRDDAGNPLGKQVADMLSQKLVESGQFLVLERPDIDRLEAETEASGSDFNNVGVDSLIIGSLVEFGRNTTGTKGFWSKSKKQTASAKVAFRLVDTANGVAYFSASGAGAASTETGEVAFIGSTASYDGSLNDAAIDAAISDVVDEIIHNLARRPWSTVILSSTEDGIYISGGKSQGIRSGLDLTVETRGRKVKSSQSGFNITLPGKKIATIRVVSTFGDNETNEGALVTVTSGSISNYKTDQLRVIEND